MILIHGPSRHPTKHSSATQIVHGYHGCHGNIHVCILVKLLFWLFFINN